MVMMKVSDSSALSAADRNIVQDLLPQKFGRLGRLWMIVLGSQEPIWASRDPIWAPAQHIWMTVLGSQGAI